MFKVAMFEMILIFVANLFAVSGVGQAEMAGNQSTTIAIYLFDSRRATIRDAEVKIDGRRCRFDKTLDQYIVDLPDPVERSRIEIRHADYESLTYEKFPWQTNRLFLHKPDDIAYYACGVKVACLPFRNRLAVVLQPEEQERNTDQIEDLISKVAGQPLRVIRRLQGNEAVDEAGDGEEFAASDCQTLAALRRHADVQHAGPLLTHTEDINEVAGLTNLLVIAFVAGTSEEEARKLLRSQDLVPLASREYPTNRCLYVELESNVGLAAVEVAAALNELEQVETADNEVFAIQR